jgi:penicillin-binding protein 2
MAIGQGFVLATPLQMARMVSAVANGGTLYRPQLVEMIASDPKNPEWVFEPARVGQIPVSAANLEVIQNSLHNVTASPSGTAYKAFEGLTVPVAGKTGTAESGREDPHAWFAAYAPSDEPEIAIVAIVENSGEGGVYAAPLVRQVVETYYEIDTSPEITPTLTLTPTVSP